MRDRSGESARQLAERRAWLEENPERWAREMFPGYTRNRRGEEVAFGSHHREAWDWLWALERGVRPPAFVGVVSRGGGKSTTAEMMAAAVGALQLRPYGLYISGTQRQANDHLQNVADMLGSAAVIEHYPLLAQRGVDHHGRLKGYSRSRLRTQSGFTMDAVGLDVGFRGMKLEEDRPGFMVLDDIDETHQTDEATDKKLEAIARKALPAGADDLAVLAIQNLIIPNGVFYKIVNRTAGILNHRKLVGPVPALEDFEYEEHPTSDRPFRITSGTPTWEGQDREACEDLLNLIGIEAFEAECQHNVERAQTNTVYRLPRVRAAMRRGQAVGYIPGAYQALGIDGGYSQRACMVAVQEVGDRSQMWKEYSFTRCDDDHIALTAARHILDYGVSNVYVDGERPQLVSGIEKHIWKLALHRGIDPTTVGCLVEGVPFGQFKPWMLGVTRWLLQLNAVDWRCEETERHEPSGGWAVNEYGEDDERYAVTTVPSIFGDEIVRYRTKPGTDEPIKKDDHGPDAWACYAVRLIPVWQQATQEAEKQGDRMHGGHFVSHLASPGSTEAELRRVLGNAADEGQRMVPDERAARRNPAEGRRA